MSGNIKAAVAELEDNWPNSHEADAIMSAVVRAFHAYHGDHGERTYTVDEFVASVTKALTEGRKDSAPAPEFKADEWVIFGPTGNLHQLSEDSKPGGYHLYTNQAGTLRKDLTRRAYSHELFRKGALVKFENGDYMAQGKCWYDGPNKDGEIRIQFGPTEDAHDFPVNKCILIKPAPK